MGISEDAKNFELFRNHYASEEDCVRILFEIKWPNGFRCQRCDHNRCYTITTRRLPLFECRSCHAQTSLIVGTIMEGSRTPISLWFQAIFLHSRPRSINAVNLAELLNVTYKTAWLICHKIRHAMSQANCSLLLSGIVRISDAVYCRRLHGSFSWHKQEQPLLIGTTSNENGDIGPLIIEHQSKAPLHDKYDSPNVKPFIQRHVNPESIDQVVVTRRYGKDMNKSLVWLGLDVTYWIGRLFRGIGPKHLQKYLDQFTYRRNRSGQSIFDQLLSQCGTTRTITNPELTGSRAKTRSMRNKRSSIRLSQQIS
jgi:hypothetical protein